MKLQNPKFGCQWIFSLFSQTLIFQKTWNNLSKFLPFHFIKPSLIISKKNHLNINGQFWKIKGQINFFLWKCFWYTFRFETSFNYIWKILRVDDDFHGTFQPCLALHIYTLISQIFKQKRRYALITKPTLCECGLCLKIFYAYKFGKS